VSYARQTRLAGHVRHRGHDPGQAEALKALYGAAIDCGATRICLADTVRSCDADGVKALVKFVKQEIVSNTV